jgi:hypothetical protein
MTDGGTSLIRLNLDLSQVSQSQPRRGCCRTFAGAYIYPDG